MSDEKKEVTEKPIATKEEERVHVSVTIDVKENKIQEFLDIFHRIILITNNEEGCLRYNIHKDKKTKNRFVLIEEWKSQQSLDNHLKADHLKVVFDKKFEEIATVQISFCKPEYFKDAKLSLIGLKVPLCKDLFIFKDGPQQIDSFDYFYGVNKKIVLFAIPGAFTPTCQSQHCPSYMQNCTKLKDELKIDKIVCLSVNDPFVLNAFGKELKSDKKSIEMLSDWNGSFVKLLGRNGKYFDGSKYGLGIRAKRFSFYSINGVIQLYFEEENPGDMKCTDAQTMYNAIKKLNQSGIFCK